MNEDAQYATRRRTDTEIPPSCNISFFGPPNPWVKETWPGKSLSPPKISAISFQFFYGRNFSRLILIARPLHY